MKIELIEDAKHCLKFASVQITIIIALIDGSHALTPLMSTDAMLITNQVLIVAAVAARLIKQNIPKRDKL